MSRRNPKKENTQRRRTIREANVRPSAGRTLIASRFSMVSTKWSPDDKRRIIIFIGNSVGILNSSLVPTIVVRLMDRILTILERCFREKYRVF